ncbi:MAG: flagellar biosynthesis protein FlgA, partial [Pseudomonadota bacterium]
MNLETLLARHGKVGGPARAALVGAGEFGASFVAQARKSGEVEVCVICDLDPERAVRAALAAGHAPEEVRPCPDRASAEQALADGAIAVVHDVALATALPVDAVLEGTGDPEGAARTARLAIEAGRHVVMATKEAEVVVGPILAHRAAERGVVHTPVDGDQPSLLIGLV